LIPVRDENPVRIVPVVTYAVLLVCLLVFVWQSTLSGAAQQRLILGLGLIPAVLFGHAQLPPVLELVPPAATVFTSMFLHGGIMHLAGNMLFLWIFSDNVEEALGRFRFVFFYALCGVAAAMAQSLPNPDSQVPMIGASGAVSGVLGAYLLLYPHARIIVMVPLGFVLQPMRLPAVAVLGLWFGIQLISSLLAGGQEGGVAFRAHLGGFVAGMVLLPVLRPGFRRRR
jgi:membrane associated rhomboid family serine protease